MSKDVAWSTLVFITVCIIIAWVVFLTDALRKKKHGEPLDKLDRQMNWILPLIIIFMVANLLIYFFVVRV